MKNIAIAFVLLFGLALFGCQKGTQTIKEPITTSVTKESTSIKVDTDASVGETKTEGKKIMTGLKVPKMVLFHGETCPHCHDFIAAIPELEKMYPGLVVEKYEVWNDPENAELARKTIAELGGKFGSVPTIVIGDQFVVGNNQPRVKALLKETYGDPVE